MSSVDYSDYFDDYLALQNNFSYRVCEKVFGDDAGHYWKKFETCERNMLYFLSCLDKVNRQLVFEWLKHYRTYCQ